MCTCFLLQRMKHVQGVGVAKAGVSPAETHQEPRLLLGSWTISVTVFVCDLRPHPHGLEPVPFQDRVCGKLHCVGGCGFCQLVSGYVQAGPDVRSGAVFSRRGVASICSLSWFFSETAAER